MQLVLLRGHHGVNSGAFQQQLNQDQPVLRIDTTLPAAGSQEECRIGHAARFLWQAGNASQIGNHCLA